MIQTMRATIQSALFMLTLALFGPLAASAAQGEFVVATRAATGTTLAAGWVRFAESVPGGGNNAGVFDIRWTGTNTATNSGGHVRVSIGANSNDETQIGMVLNDASSHGVSAIGKVHLLEGAAGTTMYLEAYVSVALSSLEFVHEAGYGWTLKAPGAGSSTGFTAHELDTTGAFAVNEGSKSFMVTKDGKVGIGTTTPGQKLSVAGTIESSSGGFKFPDGTTQLSVGTAAGWTENTGANTVYVTTTGRNIGIGTTAPKNKLDLEGGLVVGATYSGTNTAPTNGLLVEGNTGIGTTTPVNKLDVEGGLAVGATYSGTNAAPANGLLVEGKVGIGTTAPVNKLDVEGGLAVGATYSGTNAAPTNGLLVEGGVGIGTTNPGGMINGGSYFKPDLSGLNVDILSKNNEAVLNLRSNQDTDNAHIGGLYFTRDAGQSDAHRQIASIQGRQDGTGTVAGGELWFFTKPIGTAVGIDVARMMIGQSGNVGIGTTTPVNKLDVEGGLAVGATYSGTNAAPTNGLLVEGGVGIGTTTVSYGKVMIASSSVPLAFQETDVSVDQGGFWRMPLDAGILRFDVNTSPSGNFVPYTTALAMTKAGNVGIGTIAPGAKLHINQATTGIFGLQIGRDGGASDGNAWELWNMDGTYGNDFEIWQYPNDGIAGTVTSCCLGRFEIQDDGDTTLVPSGGKVGIGTTTPDQLLTVNGNASKVGGGSWAVYSDNRLKTIAGTFDAGLNEVLKLQPIRYRYKKDNPLHLPNESEHIGFSAQEVQKIIPGAISENSQGYLMLNSDPILWAMLNAIKELTAKVSEMDTLKVQLKELQDILRPTMAKR